MIDHLTYYLLFTEVFSISLIAILSFKFASFNNRVASLLNFYNDSKVSHAFTIAFALWFFFGMFPFFGWLNQAWITNLMLVGSFFVLLRWVIAKDLPQSNVVSVP